MRLNLYTFLLSLTTVCYVATGAAQDTSYTNSIGMKFVLLKPGSFVMARFQPPFPTPPDTLPGKEPGAERGYNAAEYARAKKEAKKDAQPGFTARIRKPLYIGVYEVTQAEWKNVMGTNPSVFKESMNPDSTDKHPVENITWSEVQQFLKTLNKKEKGKHYRLPTEVEWEYAARAGATDDIPWTQIREMAQIDKRMTSTVGGKEANAWGLYDMLGNVWEWVADWYNEKLFADAAPPKKGTVHVLKGASFTGDVKNATYLTHAAGPGNGWDIGFRVVLDVN